MPDGRPGWWDLDLAKAQEPSGLDITRTHLILCWGAKLKPSLLPLPPSLGLGYYEVSTHGGPKPPSRASGQGSFWALADLSHCEMWEMWGRPRDSSSLQAPSRTEEDDEDDYYTTTTNYVTYVELVGRSY